MGRPLRAASGEIVYHVLNRANARMRLFGDDGDYNAFVGRKRYQEPLFWGSDMN